MVGTIHTGAVLLVGVVPGTMAGEASMDHITDSVMEALADLMEASVLVDLVMAAGVSVLAILGMVDFMADSIVLLFTEIIVMSRTTEDTEMDMQATTEVVVEMQSIIPDQETTALTTIEALIIIEEEYPQTIEEHETQQHILTGQDLPTIDLILVPDQIPVEVTQDPMAILGPAGIALALEIIQALPEAVEVLHQEVEDIAEAVVLDQEEVVDLLPEEEDEDKIHFN